MVISGSSFEQIMMGPIPKLYIPSFKAIGLVVLEKIFEGFLLGMATVNWLTGRTTDYRLVKSVTEYSSPLKNKERETDRAH